MADESSNKNHVLKVVYSKGNYASFTEEYNFNVDYVVIIETYEPYYYKYQDSSSTIRVTLPCEAKNNFAIYIDGKKFNKYSVYEKEIEVDISEFAGTHIIEVELNDKNYRPSKTNKTFNVGVKIDFEYYTIPFKSDRVVMELLLPSDAKGNFVVELDNEIYATVPLVNGYANVSFANLSIGDYWLETYDKSLSIGQMIEIDLTKIPYGKSGNIYLNMPADANGTVKVLIDNELYTQKDLVNGSVKISFTSVAGEHRIEINYEDKDDYYYVESRDDYFTVYPTVKVSDNMVVFGKNTITSTADKSFDGSFTVSINGYEDEYEAYFKNGKATLVLPSLTAGSHFASINVYDRYANLLNQFDVYLNVSKAAKPRMTAKDTTIYYMAGSFRAVLYGVDGKAIKNANVIFKVNGKKAKTVKTNANGIATFKITNLPKTYKVTAQYGKLAVTKKVTIKRVLSLKAVTVKKSAKKLILVATLKKGKTPIKFERVIFKFNGKHVKTVITNSKGIAKAYIPATTLKALKVGKKITYSATYVKDTIKRSAKVKK